MISGDPFVNLILKNLNLQIRKLRLEEIKIIFSSLTGSKHSSWDWFIVCLFFSPPFVYWDRIEIAKAFLVPKYMLH